jgi:hypothetical protein
VGFVQSSVTRKRSCHAHAAATTGGLRGIIAGKFNIMLCFKTKKRNIF